MKCSAFFFNVTKTVNLNIISTEHLGESDKALCPRKEFFGEFEVSSGWFNASLYFSRAAQRFCVENHKFYGRPDIEFCNLYAIVII